MEGVEGDCDMYVCDEGCQVRAWDKDGDDVHVDMGGGEGWDRKGRGEKGGD